MKSVYVIGPIKGPYKIGVAIDPASRLIALQTANHVKLVLHHSVETDLAYEIESACHGFLREDRLNGEWFCSDFPVIEATIARALTGDRPEPLPKPESKPQEPVNFDLKQWRKANGYTQEQLAEAFEVSRWTIARMEHSEVDKRTQLACKALENDDRSNP